MSSLSLSRLFAVCSSNSNADADANAGSRSILRASLPLAPTFLSFFYHSQISNWFSTRRKLAVGGEILKFSFEWHIVHFRLAPFHSNPTLSFPLFTHSFPSITCDELSSPVEMKGEFLLDLPITWRSNSIACLPVYLPGWLTGWTRPSTPEFDYYQRFSSYLKKNSALISIYLHCLFSDQATRVDWFQLAKQQVPGRRCWLWHRALFVRDSIACLVLERAINASVFFFPFFFFIVHCWSWKCVNFYLSCRFPVEQLVLKSSLLHLAPNLKPNETGINFSLC